MNAEYNLGVLYEERGEYELAQKHYLQAIDECRSIEAMRNLANLYEEEENRAKNRRVEIRIIK